jgi:hypothetical protein
MIEQRTLVKPWCPGHSTTRLDEVEKVVMGGSLVNGRVGICSGRPNGMCLGSSIGPTSKSVIRLVQPQPRILIICFMTLIPFA